MVQEVGVGDWQEQWIDRQMMAISKPATKHL